MDNFILKLFSTITILLYMATCSACSCEHKSKKNERYLGLPYKNFQQFEESKLHSAEYFTCGENNTPCRKYSKLKLVNSKNSSNAIEIHQSPKGEGNHAQDNQKYLPKSKELFFAVYE